MNALRPKQRAAVQQSTVTVPPAAEQTPPVLFLPLRFRSSIPAPAPRAPGQQLGTEEPPAWPRYRPLSPTTEAPVAQNVEQILLTSGFQRTLQLASALGATQWLQEFASIDPSQWTQQGDALVFLLDEMILPQAAPGKYEVLDWSDECRAILRLILPLDINVETFIADSRQRAADAIALEEVCRKAQDVADAVFDGLQEVQTELDQAGTQSVDVVREEIDALRQRRSELEQQMMEETVPLERAIDRICEETEAVADRIGSASTRAEEMKTQIDDLARTAQELVGRRQ